MEFCNRHITRVATRRLFLASLAGFSFHSFGTLDEELVELNHQSTVNPFKHPEPKEGWERIYADERITVFRRKLKGHQIYEYSCIGSYPDISLEDFIRAQYDVEYRQKWDENVKNLQILEEETGSGMQVVRWETRYPYPLNPRLYIYVQRKLVDPTTKSVMIVSRAMDESKYPDKAAAKNSTVRVTDYSSKLLVRAHTDIENNGLDFLLVYHDDPKAPLPKKVYEFGVNVVGPKFLTDVHRAARKLAEEREKCIEKALSVKSEATHHNGTMLAFCCEHCQIGFNDQELFAFHQHFHSSNAPFHCAKCDKDFDGPNQFNMHIQAQKCVVT